VQFKFIAKDPEIMAMAAVNPVMLVYLACIIQAQHRISAVP
jgi:hypothetical protein